MSLLLVLLVLLLGLSFGSWIQDTGDCPISGKNDACYLVICRWSWAFDGRDVFGMGMGMEMESQSPGVLGSCSPESMSLRQTTSEVHFCVDISLGS